VGEEVLKDGQRERGGLAGAGLRQAEDVSAVEDGGDGLELDWARLGVAGGFDAFDDVLAEAERVEPGLSRGGFGDDDGTLFLALWALKPDARQYAGLPIRPIQQRVERTVCDLRALSRRGPCCAPRSRISQSARWLNRTSVAVKAAHGYGGRAQEWVRLGTNADRR
jgi:hypothetical protein